MVRNLQICKTYAGKINFILLVLIVSIAVTPDPSFAVFDYSFSLPIEGGISLSRIINDTFHKVTGNGLYQSLLKAGFLLSLFIAILKFGWGWGALAWKNFLVYVMGFLLLVMPLPGAGKSIPIILMDSLDNITNSIVTQLGHQPAVAGGGIAFANIARNADIYAYGASASLAAALNDCYMKAAQNRPGANRSDRSTYEGVKTDKVSPSLMRGLYNSVTNQSQVVPCTTVYDQLQDSLRSSYIEYIDKAIYQMQKMNPTLYDKQRDSLAALKDAVNRPGEGASFTDLDTGESVDFITTSNTKLDSMVAAAMDYAKKHPEAVEQSKQFTAWNVLQGIKDMLSRTSGAGLNQSILTILPRLILALLGQMALYFFDYYAYHIGILIKAAAAVAIAIGVLFYGFLGNLGMILIGTGAWMMANGTYIIASLIMQNFWDRIDAGMAATALAAMGVSTPLTDALFMLGIALGLYTILASSKYYYMGRG